MSELATIGNHNLRLRLATLRAEPLNPLHQVNSGSHPPKHDMLAVKPIAGHSGDEELAAVRVLAGVGHGQQAGLGVLAGEVLVVELVAVD